MKKFLLFAFWFLPFASDAQSLDVLHYNFVLRLSDTSELINGYTEITFVAKESAAAVSFDLKSSQKDGKGMSVFNSQSIKPNRVSLSFRHENDRVTLPLSLKAGDTAIVAVWYKGIPSDGLIISKNKYGDRTFFADNWPNRAHHWIPCNDRPDDKASFSFTVETAMDYQVISNGVMATKPFSNEEKLITAWEEVIPSPTKVMVIGVAKFATKVFDDSPPGIPVSAWAYPQDSAKGFYDYGLTPSILKFFADYIGPYPYRKLANVQSKTVFGGMENASCIFYAENSVTGDRSEEDLMAHEIAHQWFGDAASEKSFAHLWLSEGFATYFTNFYFEKKYGAEAAAGRWREDREKVIAFAQTSSQPVVDSTTDLMSLLNANSYQKGAWVLRMLRREVGDTAFQKIIREYYNAYKGGNAETRDFEAIAEKVSGKELTWFFDQWLYRPGVPRLSVKKEIRKEGVFLTVKQLQKDVYRFALPVNVEPSATKGKTGHFTISAKLQTIFLSKDSAAKIIIDPHCQLLFEEVKK